MLNRIKTQLCREYTHLKRIVIDILILSTLYVCSILIIVYFEITERFYSFSRTNEKYELDELIISLALSSFFFLIFTIRRFLELKQIVIKANTDPLIGIFNRRKGSDLIQEEIKFIEKSKTNTSLIMFDIDNFKYVNDTYGHNYGDYVLKEIIKILTYETRSTDIPIRWGGEEFIILCKRIDIAEAYNLAERYRKRIENYLFNNNLRLTASFGSIGLNTEEDLRTQIDRLDQKLYISKKNGRNQTTI